MRLRKNGSDASATSDDGTRRRNARGWGPFSGGQLTIIIVTLTVMMLLPVGAWALAFTNVAITDPGGVNQASVDANGRLSVNARPVIARDIYTRELGPAQIGANKCSYLTQAPSSKALVITSITVYNNSGTLPVTIRFFKGLDCLGSIRLIVNVVSRETKQFLFPSGLVLAPNEALREVRSGSVNVGYSVNGYYVSSPECLPPMTVNLCT